MRSSNVHLRASSIVALTLVISLLSLCSSAAAAPELALDGASSTATITVPEGRIIVQPCSDRAVRVDLQPSGQSAPRTMMLAANACPLVPGSIIRTEDGVSIHSGELTLSLSLATLTLSSTDRSGSARYHLPLVQQPAAVSIKVATPTPFYGASASPNDGLSVSGSIAIHAGSNGGAGSPVLWTTAGWGVFWDSNGGFVDIANDALTLRPAGKINTELFLIAGSPKQFFRELGALSGNPPAMPKWSLGLMHFEWGMLQKELLRDLSTFREKGIPLDVIAIDYEWFRQGQEGWGDFRWNDMNYPDGASGKLAKEILPPLGIKLLVMRKPWLEPETELGREANSRGWLLKDGKGQVSREFDFATPEARDWWWAHTAPILDTGISGYWNDEADGYDNYRFMLMQRTHYENERKKWNRRVWSLNRNFYLGSQRYGYASWSGDIDCDQKTLAGQRSMMFRSINLGTPWWGMDAGGFRGKVWWLHPPTFAGEPSSEVYARWVQLASFIPVFRIHGRHNLEREPWRYGERAEKAVIPFIKLRYALIPYLYSYARETTTSFLSIARSMPVAFPDDPQVREMEEEWMVGDYLLVRPVVETGVKEIPVYLPEGEWIDWFTGARTRGPQQIARPIDDAGWSDVGLYIREGAIIPLAPPMNWIGERPLDPLTLELFPSTSKTDFSFYDDDGVTYDSEQGAYFQQDWALERSADGVVTFSSRKNSGSLPLAYGSLVLKIHLHKGTEPVSVKLDGNELAAAINDSPPSTTLPYWKLTTDRFGDVAEIHIPSPQLNFEVRVATRDASQAVPRAVLRE